MEGVTGELSPEEKYGFAFDIDKWYPKLKEFTFPTEFLPISKSEASLICWQYQNNKRNRKWENEEEYKNYKKLEDKIDEFLMGNGWGGEDEEAVFVRMSARSAKDACISSERMKQNLSRKLYEKKAAMRNTNASAIEWQNSEFIAFFEAQIETMKFETAQQILDMHCHSKRVFEDLSDAARYRNDQAAINDNYRWNIQMAFRKCAENHEIALEFRGFVYQRQLTALSQYFDPLYFPDLVKHKRTYLKAIQLFFDSVKDKLPYDHCVMDFLISAPCDEEEEEADREEDLKEDKEDDVSKNNNVGDREGEDKEREGDDFEFREKEKIQENEEIEGELLGKLKVQVIEFNPFNRFTSGALFSWSKDLSILRGQLPFEFRIRTEPISILGPHSSLPLEGAEKVTEAKANMLVNLMSVDSAVLEEYSELLELVDNFMDDDVQRIYSNLRYVMQKSSKESFLQYFHESEEADQE